MKIEKLNFTTNNVEVVTKSKVFTISINKYIEHQFVIDQEVDTKLLTSLDKEYKTLDIDQYLFKLISSQEYCSFQLKDRLSKKFHDKKEKIDELINKYTQMGYINDAEFLNNYIDKKLDKYIGIQRIIFELEIIGYKSDVILSYLNEKHYDEELLKASELAERINLNSKEKSARKILNKLSYAGYNQEVIEKVLSKLGLLDNNLML